MSGKLIIGTECEQITTARLKVAFYYIFSKVARIRGNYSYALFFLNSYQTSNYIRFHIFMLFFREYTLEEGITTCCSALVLWNYL